MAARLLPLLGLLLALVASPAWATPERGGVMPGGGGAMPGGGGADAAAAGPSFSLPLPSPDLPRGVLTVKVVGQGMADLKVGQQVALRAPGADPGGQQTASTGADGRARFTGLTGDRQYQVVVEAEGEEHRSPPFAGPLEGGLRLLFSFNSGGKPAHPAVTGGPVGAGNAPMTPPKTMGGAMGSPHGQARSDEDQGAALIEPDPQLARGEVQVLVVKGNKKVPVPDVKVRAMGQKEPLGSTDHQGLVTLMPRPRAAKMGPLLVRYAEMDYRSGALTLPAEGGLKVTFTVYERTTKPDRVSLGGGSHLVCQIGEGVINVMQVLELLNKGDTLFDPGPGGFPLPLPRRARRVEVPSELSGVLAVNPHTPSMRLLSPLPPGRSVLRVFYELPYQDTALDVQLPMTLPAAESLLMVVNDDQVGVAGPAARRERSFAPAERQERLFGLAAVEAGGTLELTLTNLPHRDTRLLKAAVALAGLIALWALFAAWAGPRHAARRRAARDALLEQLAQLERAPVNSEQEQARRQELRRALAREWEV